MEDNIMVDNVFPTQIYNRMIDNRKPLQDEFHHNVKNLTFDYARDTAWGKTVRVYPHPNYFKGDVISEFGLNKMAELIDESVRHYCDIVKYPFGEYKRISWLTCSQQNDFIHIHNHGDFDLSGVYYYKTSNLDGDLFFRSPVISGRTARCSSMLHQTPLVYKPYVGKLLLFPSWLEHGVKRNESYDQRISLSFNIMFKDS
jgi:uncharacterized protein (TIGR02466 family)